MPLVIADDDLDRGLEILEESLVDAQPQADVTASKSVRKTYGDVVAVDGVDLEIPAGEFFTMLGPSGSGKTTTLRLIAGFEPPDEGRILLDGADVTAAAALRARREHRLPGLRALPAHDGRRERRVRAAGSSASSGPSARSGRARRSSSCGSAGFGERKPSQLSGGQRQRVALARAIVNRPQVLLLDEPLGALDLKLRQEMQIELKRIQQEVGITFIYVTHDQEEALTMSDRIAVFNDGRIEQIGIAGRGLRASRRPSSWPASSASRTCSSARERATEPLHRPS